MGKHRPKGHVYLLLLIVVVHVGASVFWVFYGDDYPLVSVWPGDEEMHKFEVRSRDAAERSFEVDPKLHP